MVKRSEFPGYKRVPRLVWIKHEGTARTWKRWGPNTGIRFKMARKVYSQPEARNQALMVSLGTVPPDSTSSSFPGRSHGDPGEASGAWGHCRLPGSGE